MVQASRRWRLNHRPDKLDRHVARESGRVQQGITSCRVPDVGLERSRLQQVPVAVVDHRGKGEAVLWYPYCHHYQSTLIADSQPLPGTHPTPRHAPKHFIVYACNPLPSESQSCNHACTKKRTPPYNRCTPPYLRHLDSFDALPACHLINIKYRIPHHRIYRRRYCCCLATSLCNWYHHLLFASRLVSIPFPSNSYRRTTRVHRETYSVQGSHDRS